MSEQTAYFWDNVITEAERDDLLRAAMQAAARSLSEMVGSTIEIDIPHIEAVPLSQVAVHAGGPETEMVGIYLLIDGDLQGQAILMLSLSDALHLVDLLIGVPPGTTTSLGDMERSALAEVGNLTLSSFLNEVSALTDTSSRPSPPAVMVDMLGAILNVVATSMAVVSDDLLIVETAFKEAERTTQAHFWVLPGPVIQHLIG